MPTLVSGLTYQRMSLVTVNRGLSRGLLTVLLLILATACASVPPECLDTEADGNLGTIVNSPFDEYAPVLYGRDQLLFTSNRPVDEVEEFRDSISKYGDDIFTSEIIQRAFAVPEPVNNPPLNTYANDGSVSFYFDSKNQRVEMLFSSFVGEEEGHADIFLCENFNGLWTEPTPLQGLVNSEFWDAHPALSADGQWLVFASDRPGGFGGSDLYIAFRKRNNMWSTPVNMGANVNSQYDEISPTFADDQTLYFASQAYSIDRKFDLVTTMRNSSGIWAKPLALPFPINTQFDEMGPAIWGDSLIFASNRIGGCGGYDLYTMNLCSQVLVQGTVLSLPKSRAPESVQVLDEENRAHC